MISIHILPPVSVCLQLGQALVLYSSILFQCLSVHQRSNFCADCCKVQRLPLKVPFEDNWHSDFLNTTCFTCIQVFKKYIHHSNAFLNC